MTLQKIRIIATGPCRANQLRDVSTICRISWYIAAHIWKIYDFKIEVVPFIKKIHEARAFNFTYRYIDDVLSINNSRFAEFLPLIYTPELEVKETTDTASSASTFSLYENPSFIIFSAETEYISTRSWYRNINFLRDRIRRIFL
jgi:hypothetical protein